MKQTIFGVLSLAILPFYIITILSILCLVLISLTITMALFAIYVKISELGKLLSKLRRKK